MRQLGASQYYLSIAKFGYALPLNKDIPSYFQRNNKSARDEIEFVRSAVDNLLATGGVIELEQPPLVSNPLTVANKYRQETPCIGFTICQRAPDDQQV